VSTPLTDANWNVSPTWDPINMSLTCNFCSKFWGQSKAIQVHTFQT
jgi:hypothetical protein